MRKENNYNFNNVPEELKDLNQWVCWKAIPDTNNPSRIKKVPISPITGKGAQSNNPTTWASFNIALTAYENNGNYTGIGFMFANGYFGVDIDDCTTDEEGKGIMEDFINTLNSYTEYSPGGKGIHIICKGSIPEGGNRHGKIEIYEKARYFTVTGNIINSHNMITDSTSAINVLHKKYIINDIMRINGCQVENDIDNIFHETKNPQTNIQKYKNKEEGTENEKKEAKTNAQGNKNNLNKGSTYNPNDDVELIWKISYAKNGTLFTQLVIGNWQKHFKSQSEADLCMCSYLAFWTNRDKDRIDRIFRKYGLMRPKWDEKNGYRTYGELTIEKACNNCTGTYTPHIKKTYQNPVNINTEKSISKSKDNNRDATKEKDYKQKNKNNLNTVGGYFYRSRQENSKGEDFMDFLQIEESDNPVLKAFLSPEDEATTLHNSVFIEEARNNPINNIPLKEEAGNNPLSEKSEEKKGLPDYFPVINEKGKPMTAHWKNTDWLFQKLGFTFKYNELTKRVETTLKKTTHLTFDSMVTIARGFCHKRGFKVSQADLVAHIGVIAEKNSYNPIKDYLIDCKAKWDGRGHIEALFDCFVLDYTIEQDEDLLLELFKKWLVTCVKMAFNDGEEAAQGVLILKGAQGIGKTRWLGNIVPVKKWVKEGASIDFGQKDDLIRALSYWIVELGEIGATMRRKEIDRLKAFITESTDAIRMPYGRTMEVRPRQTVFFGTVNNEQFLKDDTGERRNWVIAIKDIKEMKDVNIEQVWGEVATLAINKKYPHWLTKEQMKALSKQNETYKSLSAEEQLLLDSLQWQADKTEWINLRVNDICEILSIQNSRNVLIAKALRRFEDRGVQMPKSNKERHCLIPPFINIFHQQEARSRTKK